MTSPTVAKLDRLPRRPVDKFAERRAELAEAALQTLSELGYARTSVREIAQNYRFSHEDLIGTPDMVAAQMAEVMEEVAGDGFVFQGNLNRRYVAEITDGLAPALQRRGLL